MYHHFKSLHNIPFNIHIAEFKKPSLFVKTFCSFWDIHIEWNIVAAKSLYTSLIISLGERVCTLKHFRLLNCTFDKLGQFPLLKAVDERFPFYMSLLALNSLILYFFFLPFLWMKMLRYICIYWPFLLVFYELSLHTYFIFF